MVLAKPFFLLSTTPFYCASVWSGKARRKGGMCRRRYGPKSNPLPKAPHTVSALFFYLQGFFLCSQRPWMKSRQMKFCEEAGFFHIHPFNKSFHETVLPREKIGFRLGIFFISFPLSFLILPYPSRITFFCRSPLPARAHPQTCLRNSASSSLLRRTSDVPCSGVVHG